MVGRSRRLRRDGEHRGWPATNAGQPRPEGLRPRGGTRRAPDRVVRASPVGCSPGWTRTNISSCWTHVDTTGHKEPLTCGNVDHPAVQLSRLGRKRDRVLPYDPMHERCKIPASAVRAGEPDALGALASALHGPARAPLWTRGRDHHSAPHLRTDHVRQAGRRGLAPRRRAAPQRRRTSVGHPRRTRRGRTSGGRARGRRHLR